MEDQGVVVKENVPNSFPKGKVIAGVLAVVTLIIGIFIGMVGFGSKNSQQSYVPPAVINPTITPAQNTDPKLVVNPVAILESPVFTEWGGSVEGRVVAKDTDSFTLEKNSMRVQIYLQQSLTGFYSESSASATPVKSTFEAIKIGDSLRGGVTVSRKSMDNNEAHHVFANVFTVLNENITR